MDNEQYIGQLPAPEDSVTYSVDVVCGYSTAREKHLQPTRGLNQVAETMRYIIHSKSGESESISDELIVEVQDPNDPRTDLRTRTFRLENDAPHLDDGAKDMEAAAKDSMGDNYRDPFERWLLTEAERRGISVLPAEKEFSEKLRDYFDANPAAEKRMDDILTRLSLQKK